MSISDMNPLGQALPATGARTGSPFKRAASTGNLTLSASARKNYLSSNMPASSSLSSSMDIDLSLDSVPDVDLAACRMDILGKGQDKARSAAAVSPAGPLSGTRRSRATLPANFRLTFDPNAFRAEAAAFAARGSAPPGPDAAGRSGAALNAPPPAPAAGGAGISLTESSHPRWSTLSVKERIQEEEEEMAINMSLHGNPFGPRVSDQQSLNTFQWLASEPQPAAVCIDGVAAGGRKLG